MNGKKLNTPEYNLKKFYDRVQITDGCWIWIGGVSVAGRPVLYTYGRGHRAHRFSYETFVGPIPDGLYVCHHCDNILCVNPWHLFVGTQDDNMKDMKVKDRANKPKGELNGRAKLTEDDVRYIRDNYRFRHPKFGQKALARKFDVCTLTIVEVIKRNKWKHVE